MRKVWTMMAVVDRTLAGFVEFAGRPSAQLLDLALPMHVHASRLARHQT